VKIGIFQYLRVAKLCRNNHRKMVYWDGILPPSLHPSSLTFSNRPEKVRIERFHSVASTHVNLLEPKEVFIQQKSSTPTGLVWYTNMATVSLFWNTNMAAATSFQNALLRVK